MSAYTPPCNTPVEVPTELYHEDLQRERERVLPIEDCLGQPALMTTALSTGTGKTPRSQPPRRNIFASRMTTSAELDRVITKYVTEYRPWSANYGERASVWQEAYEQIRANYDKPHVVGSLKSVRDRWRVLSRQKDHSQRGTRRAVEAKRSELPQRCTANTDSGPTPTLTALEARTKRQLEIHNELQQLHRRQAELLEELRSLYQ